MIRRCCSPRRSPASRKTTPSRRAHFERGFNLDPRHAGLAHGLARLETREHHPDRAEAVLRQADRANSSLELAFELAETLISQNKIDGEDQAARYITRLENAGLGDTYVRILKARILCKQKRWSEAISEIENARAALRFDRRIATELNILLADCFGHLGADDQRLAALRQAAEDDRSADPVRLSLLKPGQVGQAGPGNRDLGSPGCSPARAADRSRASADPEDKPAAP